MTTIYYEAGLPATLIPVHFLGYAETPAHDVTGCYNVVIRLKRSIPGYHKGEILHVPARSVVEKAGVRNYHQMVKTAALPPQTPENTQKARQ